MLPLLGQETDNKLFDDRATASSVSTEIVFDGPLKRGSSCTFGSIALTPGLQL